MRDRAMDRARLVWSGAWVCFRDEKYHQCGTSDEDDASEEEGQRQVRDCEESAQCGSECESEQPENTGCGIHPAAEFVRDESLAKRCGANSPDHGMENVDGKEPGSEKSIRGH